MSRNRIEGSWKNISQDIKDVNDKFAELFRSYLKETNIVLLLVHYLKKRSIIEALVMR